MIPFASELFRDMVGTPEMRALWTEERMLEKWIDVQRAIVEAQAELGLVETRIAARILTKLSLEHLTVERIRAKHQLHQHLMVAFLKAFREVCGPEAEHFYLGPTTQDILDTAMTLQILDAHKLIQKQTLALEQALCSRALEFRDTVMMGRSHQQHTVPTTFGFILATWASEIDDHFERILESEKRWQFGNLSGISGAQNAFVEIADCKTARRLQEMVCTRLGLGTPIIDLHTRTDRFSEIVNNLAELSSSLGKIGMNLAAWQRPEVGEVEAPYTATQFSSSTSPNKVNPEPNEQIEGLAKLARGLASAMLEVRMSDNRDATRMPVHFVALPLVYVMTSRALVTTEANIRHGVVHVNRMRANLEHPAVLGQAAGERIMLALYRKTGRRDWAHNSLHRCAQHSRRLGLAFIDAILDDAEVGPHFERTELEVLSDLSTYTGTAGLQAMETVRSIRARRRLAGRS